VSQAPTRLLFVCLGNICRSPAAEGVFLHQLAEAGLESSFEVDSAGTGSWHVGQPASRACRLRSRTARRCGASNLSSRRLPRPQAAARRTLGPTSVPRASSSSSRPRTSPMPARARTAQARAP
jgi:hypothetical protein